MTLHFGKSSTRYPEQIENKFYARGKKESDRYCGLKKGDHVFSIFNGKADRLWKIKEYTHPNNKQKEKALTARGKLTGNPEEDNLMPDGKEK